LLKKDKSADVREPLLSISGVDRHFDNEEEEETKESDEVTISVNNTLNNIESNQEDNSPTKSENSEVAVVSEK
jgi:hypothetical protein